MIPWLALLGSISLLDALPPTLPEVDAPEVDAEVAQDPAAADPIPSSSTDNRVRFYVGQRMFDEDFWEPVEDHLALGLEFSAEKPTDLVGWEGGLMYSFEEEEVAGFDVDASTFEVYGGVHKAFFDPDRRVAPLPGGRAGLDLRRRRDQRRGVGRRRLDRLLRPRRPRGPARPVVLRGRRRALPLGNGHRPRRCFRRRGLHAAGARRSAGRRAGEPQVRAEPAAPGPPGNRARWPGIGGSQSRSAPIRCGTPSPTGQSTVSVSAASARPAGPTTSAAQAPRSSRDPTRSTLAPACAAARSPSQSREPDLVTGRRRLAAHGDERREAGGQARFDGAPGARRHEPDAGVGTRHGPTLARAGCRAPGLKPPAAGGR